MTKSTLYYTVCGTTLVPNRLAIAVTQNAVLLTCAILSGETLLSTDMV